ncbi:hypothetical protein PVL29_016801 [Vitis rotundifolia]|uniref:Uncharacterized protein n=1 Tax=Vitis rotundifolia TaxID=103349 RepID=A0AA39DGZ1_VITRO|nr:hypothetical protein PVL29_016801 [Vitis rotundifolia]
MDSHWVRCHLASRLLRPYIDPTKLLGLTNTPTSLQALKTSSLLPFRLKAAMDSKSTKPVKKEKAELPPRRRGRVKAWVMGDWAETLFSIMGVQTGKTEEGEGGESSKIDNPTGESGRALPGRKIKS